MSSIDLYGKAFHLATTSITGFFRVVLVDKELDLIALYPLAVVADPGGGSKAILAQNENATQPKRFGYRDFLAIPEECRQEVSIQLPLICERPRSTLTEKQKKRYDAALTVMTAATRGDVVRRLVWTNGSTADLKSIGDKEGRHLTSVLRMMSRCFMCECSPEKAAMCWAGGWGAKKARIVKAEVRLGRKPAVVKAGHSDPEFVTVLPEHQKVIEALVKSVSTKERWLLTDAAFLERIKTDAAIVAASSISKSVQVYRKLEFLSISQFRRQLEKIEAAIVRRGKRIGARKLTKDERALYGTARDLIEYPGQLYLIDSTVADIYLVSAIDRTLLVGRPIIYLVIDAFSSIILAIHITLLPPSFNEAMTALYRAMAPKEIFFEEIGIPESARAYLPQGCRPYEILADRGEMISERSVPVFEQSRISLALAAAYRGDSKSLVERQFGVANQKVLHWLKGAVRARHKERGDSDCRLDGAITVHGLYRILYLWAAEQNATKDMQKHLSTTMIRRHAEATPMGYWEYGMEFNHGSPKYLSREEALRDFIQPVEAVCQLGGYYPTKDHYLSGHRYTAQWTRDDPEFFDSVGANCQIYPDPDKPQVAYVWSKSKNAMRQIALVDTKRKYDETDASLFDIVDMEQYQKFLADERTGGEFVQRKRSWAIERRQQEDSEIAATKAALEGDTRSINERTANIRSNREDYVKKMAVSTTIEDANGPRAGSSRSDGRNLGSSVNGPDEQEDAESWLASMNKLLER